MTRIIRPVVLALATSAFCASGLAQNAGFVAREGNHFVLNGQPFYYAGSNNYYQMVYAADPSLRYAVDEVQEEMAAMGMTVLRTWAFNDGAGQWNALQVCPGVYQEYVFQGLDYVLYKASQVGLRVILPFVNNWDDYGGMNQYVAWADSAYTLGCAGFVQRNGTHLEVGGRTYYYVGANFWYGMNLASTGSGGDRARLERELDDLRDNGLTNLRVLAGSEGPNTEPWRIVPALQISPGVYDSLVLDGLDYLIYAMKQRGIRAVMCLNNFWQWSGGMAQYVNWNGGGPIPYPPPQQGGSWDEFQDYASDFYSNPGAMQDFRDHISFVVNRINPYTGIAYKDEPAVMAWELANEPRGFNNNAANFNIWIDSTAAYIKSLDANHLVTTGCEGNTPWPEWNGLNFTLNHNGPDIDYTTIHIWPQNWGWYDPTNPGGTYGAAETNSRNYFNSHEAVAVTLGKPMVLEEFGLARDGGSYDPSSATTWRDTFYGAMYQEVYNSASTNDPAAGDNFWAWAGEGRPLEPYGSYWNPGDPWIGDPPHEHQGWYSVYDADTTTLAVVAGHTQQMHILMPSGMHDDFYTDSLCQQYYESHIASVLNRVNTFNGRVYKADSTVFAWELGNEPRCTSDPSGNVLQGWIEEMSAYIKSLDTLHMVTTGSEGFYGPSGPAHNPSSWMGSQGVDFTRNHQTLTVDFACYHAWADWWGMTYTTAMTWVTNHIQDTDALIGKPVILEEYGKQQPIATRDQFFQGWLNAIYGAAQAGQSAAGSNLWILYNDDYPDYDGFGVYYPAHASTIAILEAHAQAMSLLSQGPIIMETGFNSGWHMISLPLIPTSASIDSIFGDDITGPYFIYDYSQSGGYELVQEVNHGEGYWLALENPAIVDVVGSPASDSTSLTLSENWNIVGAALTFGFPLDSLRFSDGNAICVFSSAVDSGWISPAFYGYDNALNSYQLTDSLAPWKGYWLQALTDSLTMITVSSIFLNPQQDRMTLRDETDDEDDWFVPISVAQGNLFDQLAGFGIHFEAGNGFDIWYDIPAPPIPPSGDYVRLVCYHPEWYAPVGDVFSRDVRAPFDSVSTVVWDAVVEASQAGEVSVDFGEIVQLLPPGYSAIAEHGGDTTNLMLTPSFSFQFTEPYNILITVTNELLTILDLTLSVAGNDVLLDWSDIPQAVTYYVYRSAEPYFGIAGLTPLDSTTISQYVDVGVAAGGPYFYRITYEYPESSVADVAR